ncbi:MAG: pyridoxal phosphate-dependent aminotransferase [Candidatus Micrarchaeota archaeon]
MSTPTNPAISGMSGYTLRKTDVSPIAERAKAMGKRVIDARLGDPTAFRLKPFRGYTGLVEEALEDGRCWGYADSRGLEELRAVLGTGNPERGTNGYVVPPERVFVGAGVSGVARAFFQAIIDPSAHDEVAIPKWSYIIYFAEAALSRANVRNVPLAQSGEVDTMALSDSITPRTRAVFITTVGNPLGIATSEETFRQIIDIVNRKEMEFGRPVCLVADTIYEGFRTGSEPIDPIKMSVEAGRAGPTIEFYSISKLIGAPGARLGWMRFHHDGGEFKSECERMVEALTTVFQPALGLTPNAFQIALMRLYRSFGDSTRDRFDNFASERRNAVISRTRGLLGLLSGLDGITFPRYYKEDGVVDPGRVHSPYILFGLDERIRPRAGVSQSAELAGFLMDSDLPVLLTTPADSFLAEGLRGQGQEYMRAVSLMTDPYLAQVALSRFVESKR